MCNKYVELEFIDKAIEFVDKVRALFVEVRDGRMLQGSSVDSLDLPIVPCVPDEIKIDSSLLPKEITVTHEIPIEINVDLELPHVELSPCVAIVPSPTLEPPQSEYLPKKVTSENKEFKQLRTLLGSPEWPIAVPTDLMVDPGSEQDKLDRAEGIVDFIITEPLSDKKLLDFGCGEGHVCKQAAHIGGAAMCVGYDVRRPEASLFSWDKEEDDCLLTTDMDRVKSFAPYDVIVLYDVLDHVQGDHQLVMEQVKTLCHSSTKIYVTCHPWVTRHGGHMYFDINKAFFHLLFTPEEIERLGYTVPAVTQIVRPSQFYPALFSRMGMKIEHAGARVDRVEEFFFKNELVFNRLKNRMQYADEDPNLYWAAWQMRQTFVDYTLVPSNDEVAITDDASYIVAKLNHVVGGRNNFVHSLYSSGSIITPDDAAKWEVADGKVTMIWPDSRAPDGAWRDVCELSDDRQSYIGKNQQGSEVKGTM